MLFTRKLLGSVIKFVAQALRVLWGYRSIQLCLIYYAYILIGFMLYRYNCIDFYPMEYCHHHLLHDTQSLNWDILLSLFCLIEGIFKCIKERSLVHLLIGILMVAFLFYSGWWFAMHGYFSTAGIPW